MTMTPAKAAIRHVLFDGLMEAADGAWSQQASWIVGEVMRVLDEAGYEIVRRNG